MNIQEGEYVINLETGPIDVSQVQISQPTVPESTGSEITENPKREYLRKLLMQNPDIKLGEDNSAIIDQVPDEALDQIEAQITTKLTQKMDNRFAMMLLMNIGRFIGIGIDSLGLGMNTSQVLMANLSRDTLLQENFKTLLSMYLVYLPIHIKTALLFGGNVLSSIQPKKIMDKLMGKTPQPESGATGKQTVQNAEGQFKTQELYSGNKNLEKNNSLDIEPRTINIKKDNVYEKITKPTIPSNN